MGVHLLRGGVEIKEGRGRGTGWRVWGGGGEIRGGVYVVWCVYILCDMLNFRDSFYIGRSEAFYWEFLFLSSAKKITVQFYSRVRFKAVLIDGTST